MSDISTSAIKPNQNSKPILQLITCPICLEIFREPLQLPCQHTFCKTCLERVTQDRWGRCPVCRGCYRVPYAGIGSLEVNRTIVNLLESLSHSDSKPMLQAKCAICKLDDTITVCEHCREAICCQCRREHYNEFCKYICLKLNETQQETEKLIAKEEEHIKIHEENVHHSDDLTSLIREKVTRLIEKIKDEEKKLLVNIQEFHNTEQRLIKEKNNCLQDLKKIQTFCLKSQEKLHSKQETDQEAVEIREKCEEYVLNINELQNEILVVKIPHRRISFFNRDISSDAISLGFIEIGLVLEPIESSLQLSSIKSHPKQISHCLNTSTIDEDKLLSIINGNICCSPSTYNHKRIPRIIGKRGTQNKEFVHPSSLAYSKQDQLIYVCDNYNNRLVTYGINGCFQQVYNAFDEQGTKRFEYPYAIHIDSNNRLYLIDQSERRIKVLNTNFQLIRIIGQYGRDIGQYSAPCDLCTNEDNFIFVCDAGSHRILKYNEQGQFLLAWGGLGTDAGQFKCPACICILNHQRLAVSDWGNDRIQIFNYEGDHLLTIGQRGKRLGEFSRPLGLAFDEKTERLFICDEGNNRVMIFNHDFTKMDLVQSKIGFHGPYDILLLKTNRMIISEYHAHRLQII